ncbi:hydrogenase maturation protease [Paludibaculum fermentans]|uniref:Hydrogenase maturation protease n=1 Tax=Paludibaculum fermentans TaxID=1473598 RepID=A0A7S7SLY2_PALFE|nr:hydrogenase maturation protease [Paludibaculum fermentans]QOY89844.1 hydrogenase maturation protease [Paludibaculum fermentans]
MSTLIAGLGNVLMGDDAIGPTLIYYLQARYDFPPDVELKDLGTPGIDLAQHLAGRGTVILLDAMVDAQSTPGSTRTVTLDDLHSNARPLPGDVHSPDLRESLKLAALLGEPPQRVVLLGIVVSSCELGNPMSPQIRDRMEAILGEVTAELAKRQVPFTARPNAVDPDLWWQHRPAC